MERESLFSFVTMVIGGAVLGTLGYSLSTMGNYHELPPLSPLSPGLAEVAVVAVGLVALLTMAIGLLSYDSPHAYLNLGSSLVGVALLARPLYATMPMADLAWTGVGLLGAVATTAGVAFLCLVEGRRHLRRVRKSRRRRGTGG